MNNFDFYVRTKLKFGAGEALNLAEYMRQAGFKKTALLIDQAVLKSDYGQEIIKKTDFFKVSEYNLGSEPDYDSLEKWRTEFIQDGGPLVDSFVAIGGGSVIDFAKGLATLTTNLGPAISYRGFPDNLNPSLPLIAVPTTAGTGSEVTYNAAFIDQGQKKKLGINTTNNFPVLAVLDPNLTLTCPETVSISSGLDALVHVFEGYGSVKSGRLTKIFAKEGFKLVFENLPKIIENPADLHARGNLQLGAYLGGLTLLGSGGGPTGALSYTLGVNFKVPHGLAGGVFLPYIASHNLKMGYDYAEFECGGNLSEKLFELYQYLKAPLDLKCFHVSQSNAEPILKDIESFGGAFSQNPVPFTVEDAKKLVLKLIK